MILQSNKDQAGTKYNFRLVSIDAWRDESGWYWNQSYMIRDSIAFKEHELTARKLCKWLRDNDILTRESAGRVRVNDMDDLIEIQAKNTQEPLFCFELLTE